MCRSIKPLRIPDRPATHQEIEEAALQYIRKVSGYRKPSQRNQQAFDQAVAEVARTTSRMLERLGYPPSSEPVTIPSLKLKD